MMATTLFRPSPPEPNFQGDPYAYGGLRVWDDYQFMRKGRKGGGQTFRPGPPIGPPVELFPPVNIELPELAGIPAQAQTLSSNLGTWEGTLPIGYGYQWYRVDVTAPIITSSATATNVEGTVLAHGLTASEAVTWSIVGGADATRFQVVGSILRWTSNGVKDFEIPNDANVDNVYLVTVQAVDAAGLTATQAIAVTVTNVVEAVAPVNTTLPDVSGIEASGETLDSTDGIWSGTTPIIYSYQWYRVAEAAPPGEALTADSVVITVDGEALTS